MGGQFATLVFVILCCASANAQAPSVGFSVTGIVTDASGGPIPGATISVEGRDAVVMTDALGVFVIRDLAAGQYEVSASVTGFRAQTQQVLVPQPSGAQLKFALRLGLLAEVHWVLPEPREAVRRADAIAHVRLDGLAPVKLRCADLAVIAALRDATVISVWKGQLPRRIQIVEQDTGTCVEDDGSLNASPNESSYLAGSEYIVLLSDGGARFGGLGPAEYTFLVSGSIVKTNGFMGSPDSMSLRDFRTLLLKVGQ